MKKYIIGLFVVTVVLSHCSERFNKKVLITSPDGYAQRFSESIKNEGLVPVSIPMIETVIPDSNPQLDSLLLHLFCYDWVALPSRKAIQAFFQQATSIGIHPDIICKVNFCVIGKDAELLREYGAEPAFEPNEPSPMGIVATLANRPHIQGKSIAILVPEVVGITEPNVVPNFIKGLEDIGMRVKRIDAYVTRPAGLTHPADFVQSVLKGKYDVIAFTSTGEVEAFLKVMEGHPIPAKQIIACFGPYTAANTRKLKLKVEIISKDFSSFDGFAKTISEALKSGIK